MKKDWLPYAAVVALILGSWKVYNNRKSHSSCCFELPHVNMGPNGIRTLGVRKCLKPDVYQEFNLKEKTVLSHNVAM